MKHIDAIETIKKAFFKQHQFGYLNEDKKLLWLPTPKAGSTTMRQVLPVKGFVFKPAGTFSFEAPEGWTTFGIWRHPVTWLQSLWKMATKLDKLTPFNEFVLKYIAWNQQECDELGIEILSQWVWVRHMDEVIPLDRLESGVNDLLARNGLPKNDSIGVFHRTKERPWHKDDYDPDVLQLVLKTYEAEIERYNS